MSNDVTKVAGSLLSHHFAAKTYPVEPRSPAGERQMVSTGQQKTVTQPDRAQLDQALAGLTRQAQIRGARVQFQIKDHYGELVLQVLDAENRELIRQIPSEEALRFAKFFRDLESTQGPTSIQDARNLAAGLSFWEGLLIDTQV